MDFSDIMFSPVALLKFGDEDDFTNWSEILTPRTKNSPHPRAKDSPHPRTKCVHPPQLEDDDSGLGMEFDNSKLKERLTETYPLSRTPRLTEFCQSYSIRRSLFEKSKRLVDGDDDGSITKKPRHSRRSTSTTNMRRTLTKSLSFGDQPLKADSACDVISAVERLVEKENLIGNGANIYTLPIIPGRHSDLKSITSETMTDVLEGRYNDVISSYRIIDCRYPYEYNAGHIKGAENLYTRDQIQEVAHSRTNKDGGRHILIFHCEFSSERGPKMSRFLRSKDRELNSERYPFLNFPEVYLLHNGYKAFYETNKALCEPMSYTPMLHENHADDLRHFRSKSKSWCAGVKTRRSHRLT